MQIILNGEISNIIDNQTVAGLIESEGLSGKRLAIEINMEIIPASEHDSYVIAENDNIEIVHAIGGG